MYATTIDYAFERAFFRDPPKVIVPLVGYLGYYSVYNLSIVKRLQDEYKEFRTDIDQDALYSDLQATIHALISGAEGCIVVLMKHIHGGDLEDMGWQPRIEGPNGTYIAHRIITDNYIYYLGVDIYGDEIIAYCYDRHQLEKYLSVALRGFDLELPDGDKMHIRYGDYLRINHSYGGCTMLPCYYMDATHFAFGDHICKISGFYDQWVGDNNTLKLVRHDLPYFRFLPLYEETENKTEVLFTTQGSDSEVRLNAVFGGNQTHLAASLNDLLGNDEYDNYLDYDFAFILGFNDDDFLRMRIESKRWAAGYKGK